MQKNIIFLFWFLTLRGVALVVPKSQISMQIPSDGSTNFDEIAILKTALTKSDITVIKIGTPAHIETNLRFSASCSPGEDQYSGSEGVALGKSRRTSSKEKSRNKKVAMSKELPRSSGKNTGRDRSKTLRERKIPQAIREPVRPKGGSGNPQKLPGNQKGASKDQGETKNSIRGKTRRKESTRTKGKPSGSRLRPNLLKTPRPNELSPRAQTRVRFEGKSVPTSAPPLPITGKEKKKKNEEEQLVEYDISLPELVDYELVEYTVDLGAPSQGPRPQPSPALLSALTP